ncbi:MAG TPA: TonB-dependent receptor [Thermoanaerobaculia bacterium]
MKRSLVLPLLAASLVAIAPTLFAAPVAGSVLSSSGRPVAGASIFVRAASGETFIETDPKGTFSIPSTNGDYTIDVVHEAYISTSVEVSEGETSVRVVLEPNTYSENLTVIGSRIAAEPAIIPGSVDILDRTDLKGERAFTTGEALRKVAGIQVRDEEGLGLRPNIGIRGLNPTRSSKVLLLEDGIPLGFAPYGDNAAYYHPPIERFESIEVVKGSGQVAYGPSTVGGVINYLTPAPPTTPTLGVTVATGNRGYSSASFSAGGTWGPVGILVDVMRKESEGARENTHSLLNDFNAKLMWHLSPKHHLTFRGSHYAEDSMVTYSGLRQAEFEANPRQNLFRNDNFEGNRTGLSIAHGWTLGRDTTLTTTFYGSRFARDWWRQSSNSNQRPNDSADPNCGGIANLYTTCGNEGRLRDYETWGIESRLRFVTNLGSLKAETETGIRTHSEQQQRVQLNGDTPLARTGRMVEDNSRENEALAMFVQTRFGNERWGVTPGVRFEQIDFRRTNKLAQSGAGVSGRTELTQLIPGIGFSWTTQSTTYFAGVHRGFAPPRTEDIINNSTGGVVDLDPEMSWNSELGFRTIVRPGLALAGTLFRMDYDNQIVPTSVAGGVGATLTNGGRTLHQGIEASGRVDTAALLGTPQNFYTKFAYTWLPDASYTGQRMSAISGHSNVSVSGNRLPYAPEHLFTGGVGYMMQRGVELYVEAVHLGSQFADDLNTIAPTADGQRGRIDSHTIFNATVNIDIPVLSSTFFVTVKNALDETYIVDRSRGILPGSPRLIQAGISFRR